MPKREILGYLIFFKGISLAGLMVLLIGIEMWQFLRPLYWGVLAIGVLLMLVGLGMAAVAEKWEE
jgi:hypothetical protein